MCAVPPGYGAGSAAARWRHGRPEGVSVARTVASRPGSRPAPARMRGRVSRVTAAVRPGLRRTALLALGCNAVLELVQILGVDGYPWRFKTPTYAAHVRAGHPRGVGGGRGAARGRGPLRGDVRTGLDRDRGARVREPREGAVPARAALPRRLAVRRGPRVPAADGGSAVPAGRRDRRRRRRRRCAGPRAAPAGGRRVDRLRPAGAGPARGAARSAGSSGCWCWRTRRTSTRRATRRGVSTTRSGPTGGPGHSSGTTSATASSPASSTTSTSLRCRSPRGTPPPGWRRSPSATGPPPTGSTRPGTRQAWPV